MCFWKCAKKLKWVQKPCWHFLCYPFGSIGGGISVMTPVNGKMKGHRVEFYNVGELELPWSKSRVRGVLVFHLKLTVLLSQTITTAISESAVHIWTASSGCFAPSTHKVANRPKVQAVCFMLFSPLWVTVHSLLLFFSLTPFYQDRYHSCGVHHLPQRELVFALPSAAGHHYHLLPQASALRPAAGTHKPTLLKILTTKIGLVLAHPTHLLTAQQEWMYAISVSI